MAEVLVTLLVIVGSLTIMGIMILGLVKFFEIWEKGNG